MQTTVASVTVPKQPTQIKSTLPSCATVCMHRWRRRQTRARCSPASGPQAPWGGRHCRGCWAHCSPPPGMLPPPPCTLPPAPIPCLLGERLPVHVPKKLLNLSLECYLVSRIENKFKFTMKPFKTNNIFFVNLSPLPSALYLRSPHRSWLFWLTDLSPRFPSRSSPGSLRFLCHDLLIQ